ncbi:IS3 family transposase [Humibacillus sp. DSM 29435]|uniref:IS3 family transposase n=1 Tax=Humibacillus sp. DSM 29435 TaxID=1869167 RepID=UPI00352B993C
MPSTRVVNDERLKAEMARVHQENYGVYGIRKVHAQLAREHVVGLRDNQRAARPVARCTTQRLMRELGLRGLSRAKGAPDHGGRNRPRDTPGPGRAPLHRRRPRPTLGR